ncbi:MAG TPA: DEAD/DEAH box helicase [Dermatophilaceae bacterium]|nr:DEAD/DEAH box helicase [Dermatophilaceae bacterium]
MATPTLTLAPALRAVADACVAAMAGPGAALRGDQETAVAALTDPAGPVARVLVVQATGWGKSAVYWSATAIARSQGRGPTLVVSPLLSLMRDQVAAAGRAGLRAATLNSGNVADWAVIEADLLAGALDLLLVSPERLANPGFGARVMDRLAGRLGLLVIDEAHAVSDWGHDFRPDYRRVADVLRALNPGVPVLATTATANARVTEDVAAQLGDATVVLRGPLARSSLQLAVLPDRSPLERYAFVVDHLPDLPGSGIVYTLTVADADRLAGAIQAVHGRRHPVASYTGQLDPADRERLEEALRANDLKALVATSALGMGFDKPDLGFVVHVGAPPSPVSYYQQVGRAGRGIDHALVALLPSAADAGVWDYFATATVPVPEQVHRLLDGLQRYAGGPPATAPSLEAETGLRRTRVELMLRQLAVERVVERVDGGWRPTGVAWQPDLERYEGIVAVRRREADIMRAYCRGERCLMQLLQESLDDPTASPCGRCSVCLGRLPEPLRPAASPETAAAVTGHLRGEVHVLPPRKMWPGGDFGARGRIPPALMAAEGRVLAQLDAPEWAALLRRTFDHDAPPDPDLAEAAVATLRRWSGQWAHRPTVVLGLPAAGYPRLVAGLVDHLAGVGRLPQAGLAVSGPWAAGRAEQSSAQEARFWREAISVPGQLGATLTGACVLLVVDATSSLWPVTVAAAKVREAGASSVLPLVVHRRP